MKARVLAAVDITGAQRFIHAAQRRTVRVFSTGLLFTAMVSSGCRERQPYWALTTGDTNYLQKYFTSGGDINQLVPYERAGHHSVPPIDVAFDRGQLETFELLLKWGADPNRRTSDGVTPLTWVVGRGDFSEVKRCDMARLLVSFGADVNRPNMKRAGSSADDWTPLMEASMLGETHFVECLLELGAKVNQTNELGQTALHVAKDVKVARQLLFAGANADLRDQTGETPARRAARNRQFDVVDAITNYGVVRPWPFNQNR